MTGPLELKPRDSHPVQGTEKIQTSLVLLISVTMNITENFNTIVFLYLNTVHKNNIYLYKTIRTTCSKILAKLNVYISQGGHVFICLSVSWLIYLCAELQKNFKMDK